MSVMEKRKTAVLVTLAYAGLCIGAALAQATATQCDRIGNAEAGNQARRASRDERFYLDEDNPAPCHGNVTSWRVCYYGPGATLAATSTFYWATYAVYRPEVDSDGDLVYRRVSEIYRAIRYANSLINAPEVDGPVQPFGFACYDDLIDVGDNPFTIQAGDVIGACVFNPDGNDNIIKDILTTRRELDVVGETATDSESLLEMDDDGCDIDELPSNVERNELSTVSSRRLHIKANIAFQTPSPPVVTDTTTKTRDMATTAVLTRSTPPTSATVVFPSSTGGSTTVTWTTPPQSTHFTKEQGQQNAENITGPVVGGVIISVIVLLSLLVMVISVVMCYRHRKGDFIIESNVAYHKRNDEEGNSGISMFETDYATPRDCCTNTNFSQTAVSKYYENESQMISNTDGDFAHVENIAYKAIESSGYTNIDGETHQDVDEYDYVYNQY